MKMNLLKLIPLLLLGAIIVSLCSIPRNKKSSRLNNKSAILLFRDSIDHSLSSFNKQKSLPYSSGDYTFTVTRYNKDNKSVIIVDGDSGEYGTQEERYYLNNNQIILYSERVTHTMDTTYSTAARAFYANGSQFAAEVKEAEDETKLAGIPFRKSTPLPNDIKKDLDMYKDALKQSGVFDLTFDGVIESPKARYIILGDDTGYWSSLLVRREDDFARELLTNTASYRGRKLTMEWEKQDNEYVYVSGKFR